MPIPVNPHGASGGQSQADFFWVRLNSGGTGYDILDPSSLPSLASPTALGASPLRASAIAYSVTMTQDTKPTPQDDGTLDIPFDNYEDSKPLHDYLLDPFAIPPASVTGNLPEWFNELGQNQTAASSSNQMLVVVVYGNKNATDGMKITAAFGSLKKTSGAHGQKSDDWSKPTIEFDGNKTQAVLTIPSSCIDSSKVTPASITIASGTGFKRTYMTAV